MGLAKKGVELNVDSVSVVKVIKEGETNSAMGYSLVKEIHRLVSLEWEAMFGLIEHDGVECSGME
ncbi:hypothetical protein L195_g036116 [Trifolium pratense]|uniref:RNase H type-1 domain-containing protein n=1 Tax=Trifolium pratense TaxID=57577 RepID=A0A2K3LNL1_TRIPR|nr:hypothetical protein L195_g036116 [Trifolium pratense]